MIECTLDKHGQNDMLIPCDSCGGRAVVRTRREMAARYFEVYVTCKDPLCGSSDKWGVSHVSNLSPSAKQYQASLFSAVNELDADARQSLIEQLTSAPA